MRDTSGQPVIVGLQPVLGMNGWWDFGQKPSSISVSIKDETWLDLPVRRRSKHIARETREWLRKKPFKILEGSSQSLELNPKENH